MFEYLGILIAVILGLSLTHLLRGLAKLIHLRRDAKIYWVHIVWTVNMLIYVLAVWWGMYWWTHLHDWTILEFFFIAGYCTVLFMLASILYPTECLPGEDFEHYFYANKSWFFGTQILAFLLDIPETLAKAGAHQREVPLEYFIFIPLILAINVAALVTDKRRIHAVLCVAWLAVMIWYLTFTSIDTIIAR